MGALKVNRAATYLRISLDDGTDYAELGIDRQREAVRHLAQAKGWSLAPGWEVVDQGVSASNRKKNRPGFQRLLAGMREGHIDGVMAYAVDRLARRLEDLQELIAVAEEFGIPVTTVSGDLDLSNASGQGMAKMLGVIAEMETKRMGERMRARKLQNARKGSLRGGGRRPYGFTSDRRQTVPEEAEVIRDAARRIIDGQSPSSIVRDLNERRIPTSCDTGWTLPRLTGTLKRPTLTGKVTYKGEILRDDDGEPIRGEWTPILADEVFEDLQVALAARKQAPHPLLFSPNRRHLLSGMSRCGLCGHSMIGFRQTNGNWAYVCRVKKHLTRNKTLFEAHVIEQVKAKARETTFEVGAWSDEETERVRRDIARLEQRKAKAALEFADGSLPADVLRSIITELESRISDLRSSQVGQALDVQTTEAVRFDYDDLDMLPIDEQRNAIAVFVDRIVVHPQGRGKRFDPTLIEIQWRDLTNPRLRTGMAEA